MEDLILSGMPQAIPFLSYVGVTLTEAKPERAVGFIVQRLDLHNHIPTLHAGVLLTLADSVVGAAVVATFFNQISTVKIIASGADVSYHLPARGKITATATLDVAPRDLQERLSSNGVVTFSGTASLIDEKNACVATIKLNFHTSINDLER